MNQAYRNPRICFEQFNDPMWTGGMVYIQNLLKAITLLDDDSKPYTMLAHRQDEAKYNAIADEFLSVPNDSKGLLIRAFRAMNARMKLGIELRPKIADVVTAAGADVLFSCNSYPKSIKIPIIGWIPDFQYLHLPEFAGQKHVDHSTQSHHAVIDRAAAMVVSSHDVLKDLVNFAPDAADRASVVPFVAQVPEDVYTPDPRAMCEKYSLPERFFYLPNQFWKHKNHLLVVKALKILKSRSIDATVVCTGNTLDFRDQNYFASVLTAIAEAGIHDRFRMLGLVPRPDVFQLNRQSLAVLQPSLFEGWSTSIEEAKSLGKRVVASDLAVQLEQIPDADFFDRNNAESLADQLARLSEQASPGPDLLREAIARRELPIRSLRFATQFMDVVYKAVGHQTFAKSKLPATTA